MNNFFLLNEAIDLNDYKQFKEGVSELMIIEKEDNDNFLKHNSVWETPVITNNLFSTSGQEENAIILFIEQIKTIDGYLNNQDVFNKKFPDELNAFLGIDFTKTSVCEKVQITNPKKFCDAKRHYYIHLKCNGDKNKIKHCLQQLYGKYQFEEKAIDDINYFNQTNNLSYERIHDLLTDIKEHPYQGGIGKTEVLKQQGGIASKRINDEHRLTYQIKNNMIIILTCKGHYN